MVRTSLGPAAFLGGLIGLLWATSIAAFLPAKGALLLFLVLIVAGAGVGIVGALTAGRVIGSAGWRSYTVVFGAPLIVATIPWWSGLLSVIPVAMALLGGAFIGRFIIHRASPPTAQRGPSPAQAIPVPTRAAPDPDRSIVGLRLEDAMVDADGTAYGTGRLDFPPDTDMYFSPSPRSALSMRLTLDGELVFAACAVLRDAVSGYLIGHRTGPELVIPHEASSVIRTVLAHEERAPLTFSVRRGGALVEGELGQGLTNMFGSVQGFGAGDDDGGVVVVQLTASLRAGRKDHNYWPASPVPDKVSLSFTIKPVERVVRFGAHSGALPREYAEAGQSLPSELDSMRLADTLIGSLDQSYGRAEDGSIVALHTRYYREPTLTLELGLRERRDRSGLVVASSGYPRIRFTPVDLDDVAERIGANLRFLLELGEGPHESIQYTGGSPDGPGRSERTSASRLGFDVVRAGLVIDWIAFRHGNLPPLEGRVTIPWEVLVMRFPRFARYRESVRNLDESS